MCYTYRFCELLPVFIGLLWVRSVDCLGQFDYYDLQEEYGRFSVECGNSTHRTMSIEYFGEANAVYADLEPTNCTLEEKHTAVFVIEDALLNPDCPISTNNNLEIVVLELVVQTGHVRKVSDATHIIMCNYEIGGHQISPEKNTDFGWLPRQPEWQNAGDHILASDVTIDVYGIDGNPVTEVVLGSYIQLRAFFTPAVGEESIRVWNCRAVFEEAFFYMFANGCGDGQVVPMSRGFRTAEEEAMLVQGFTRVARSAYFRAFTFPGQDTMEFECDYNTCLNSLDCDGLSCENAVSVRRRRQSGFGRAIEGLRSAHTNPIHITETAEALPGRGSVERRVFSYYDWAPQMDNRIIVVTTAAPARTTPAPVRRYPSMLTMSLVSAIAVMSVLLVTAVIYSAILWRQRRRLLRNRERFLKTSRQMYLSRFMFPPKYTPTSTLPSISGNI